jgi:hypothetical protein
MIDIGKGVEREVAEYWLNEGQALLICMVVAGGDVLDATRKIAERGQIWGNRTLRPGRAYRKPACALFDVAGYLTPVSGINAAFARGRKADIAGEAAV